MAATARLQIDLQFSLVEPASGDADEADVLTGSVTADGAEITVFASDPGMLVSGRRMSLPDIRTLAAEIAGFGLSVTLTGPGGVIARIGAVDAPAMQRLVTGSPHIRVGNAAALAPLLRRRDTSTAPLPLPPPTLFPLVPTVSRRIRRHATTTHAQPGAGRPRLIFVVGSEYWDGTPPREFNLLPTTTRIGAGPDADLRLDDLTAVQAEIRHGDDDEYILYPVGELSGSSSSKASSTRSDGGQVLRTGARIDLGPWKMAYFREEFADHGRPHGGRVGGEFARQKPQHDPRRDRAAGSTGETTREQ